MTAPGDHSNPDDPTWLLGNETVEGLEELPDRIGPYRLIRRLGAGGMGQVFLAEQLEPVEREVALKLIRRRGNQNAATALFEVERQILARLNHPAIAQIYDAGSNDGQSWFAMELVDGEPLTEHSRRYGLELSEQLGLFIRICQGVQYAHQRGILHRDLKPANILVSRIDERSVPRIIDFGVATSLETHGGDDSNNYRAGTPAYMSPQLLGEDDHSADVRDDVYALGVILFELLLGERLPESADGRSREMLCQALKLRRSTILQTAYSLEDSDQTNDLVQLVQKSRRLAYELRCILATALAVNPKQRYQTVAALGEDLQRFLEHRPVSAVPDSTLYRLGRFGRRHALALGAGSLILTALIAGLVASTLSLREAQRQNQLAEQRQQELVAVVGFQQAMLDLLDPRRIGEKLVGDIHPDTATDQVREVLLELVMQPTEIRIAEELATSPLTRARLEQTLGGLYRNWGDYPRARQYVQAALEGFINELGDHHADTLEATRVLAEISWFLGDTGLARELHQQLLDWHLELLGADDHETLQAMNNLGLAMVNDGDARSALPLHETVFSIRRANLGMEHVATMAAAANLVVTLGMLGEYERALELSEKLLAYRSDRYGTDHHRTLNSMRNQASLHERLGNLEAAHALFAESLQIRRRIDGHEHPETLWDMNLLATVLRRMGHPAEARSLEEQALASNRRLFGDDHPDTLWNMNNLAATLLAMGELAQARQLAEGAAHGRESVRGPEHRDTLMSRHLLGRILLAKGRAETARDILAEVLDIRIDQLGHDHRDTVATAALLLETLLVLDDHDAAFELYQTHLEWLVDADRDRLARPLHELHDDVVALNRQLQATHQD